MQIEWPEKKSGKLTGRKHSYTVPENIAQIIHVIGIEMAATLLLKLGGAPLTVPDRRAPNPNSMLVKAIGIDAAQALSRAGVGRLTRVPIGNRFLARYFFSQGHGVHEIARMLRVSDVQVGRLLNRTMREAKSPNEIAEHLEERAEHFRHYAQHLRKRKGALR